MIDKKPLFYTILDGTVLPVRCNVTTAPQIDHLIPHGDVVIRHPALDGSDRYEYRKLVRLEDQTINETIVDRPFWTAPLHPHEMPPLIALYITLSQ